MPQRIQCDAQPLDEMVKRFRHALGPLKMRTAFYPYNLRRTEKWPKILQKKVLPLQSPSSGGQGAKSEFGKALDSFRKSIENTSKVYERYEKREGTWLPDAGDSPNTFFDGLLRQKQSQAGDCVEKGVYYQGGHQVLGAIRQIAQSDPQKK